MRITSIELAGTSRTTLRDGTAGLPRQGHERWLGMSDRGWVSDQAPGTRGGKRWNDEHGRG